MEFETDDVPLERTENYKITKDGEEEEEENSTCLLRA